MSQESIVASFDHSWTISIFVEELDSHYNMRVKDSTVVSTLITDLINGIHLKYDWMEFALWCDSKKMWLLPKTSTLLAFSLHSDSGIRFVRRFRMINIQLPDLQIRQMMLDFSKTVFKNNQIVCRKMGIRHHEELSFQYRSTDSNKYQISSLARIKKNKLFSSQQDMIRSNWSIKRNTSNFSPLPAKRESYFRSFSLSRNQNSPKLRQRTPMTPSSAASIFSFDEIDAKHDCKEGIYFESFENSKLANSPEISYEQALKNADIFDFKSYHERAKFRFPWMVSELTLMEQGIDNYDTIVLLLRYKYHNYFYLNEKYDSIRINQIFQQAVWSVLSNETDCSEDEALSLGGLLLQVKKSWEKERNKEAKLLKDNSKNNLDEEINVILDKLQLELLGRCNDEIDDTSIKISGFIHLIKYPNYFFRSFEKYFAEIKDDGIHIFSKRKVGGNCKSLEIIPIKGNEIELRVKIWKKETFILEIMNLKNDLETGSKDERKIEKYKLKFIDKTEFIRWSTGCRLLAKSIDFTNIADFRYEYNVVTNIVDIKRPSQISHTKTIGKDEEKLNLSDFITARFNKPFKRLHNLEKVVKFQKSCSHYNSVQSKIAYIKCWLTLQRAGYCYFEVTLNRGLNKELVAIGYNRLTLADINTGKLKKIWELSKLVTWDTNWELLQMAMVFSNEKFDLAFSVLDDCQTFHEHLGGYLFIMMRNSGKYSDLSEKSFRQLTAQNKSKIV